MGVGVACSSISFMTVSGDCRFLVGLLARAHHPREHGEGVDVGRGGDDHRVGEELWSLEVDRAAAAR